MNPIAVGGVGGSGTRVIAQILQHLGVYIGSDLSPEKDNLWYALLFGRRDIFLASPRERAALIEFFLRQMSDPQPLTDAEDRLIARLANQDRIQHAKPHLAAWAESFRQHGKVGSHADHWGWKVPYTYLLADEFLELCPELRYVHITRDGRDMAFSRNQNQLSTWGPLVLNRNVEVGPRDALSFWCEVHRRMSDLNTRWGNRVFHFDFDDLVQEPAPQIGAFLTFVGQDASQDRIDELCALIRRPETVGRHRSKGLDDLAAADLRYLEEIQA